MSIPCVVNSSAVEVGGGGRSGEDPLLPLKWVIFYNFMASALLREPPHLINLVLQHCSYILGHDFLLHTLYNIHTSDVNI